MPGLFGPAGVRGQARRVSRRTSRRTARRQDMMRGMDDGTYDAPDESSEDITAQLEKLGSLHASGILTDQEFADKKSELLARL